MIALLLGGTLVLCAGVLAIVFGVPIKEFNVGSTLIQSGAVVASAGVLLIGMGLVVRELKQLGRRLDAGLPGDRSPSQFPKVVVATVPQPALEPGRPARTSPRAPDNGDFLFPRDQPQESPSLDELDVPLPPLSQPWPDEDLPERPVREAVSRDSFQREPGAQRDPGGRARPPLPPRPETPAEDKPRRDFLFSSRRRPADELTTQPSRPPEQGPDFGEPPGSMEPPLFDSSWPPPEEARPEPDFIPEPRTPRQRPQTRFPAQRREEVVREGRADVTVVKSGVVDTMAYSLYSDGSIEAQLPEGTVRFESIEELRAHLDRRGA
ncbi:MAG: hypothetical protein K2W78_14685 [Xanthobacteraceae bacterium]|nr:hypothetical protein [Xanthobacteraceae bacterium]